MVLAVDIGNSNIVLGGFSEDGELLFQSRLLTDKNKTADEYAVLIKSVLQMYGAALPTEGCVISSVVPTLTSEIRSALERFTVGKVVVVGPGVKTGFSIKLDDPAELGADLASSAAGAISKYGYPCIIADFGTATKFTAVDKNGAFLGGSIMPGIKISADALFDSASMLPHISFSGNVDVIGKNTVNCMRSGIILGAASMLDGMIKKYKSEMGENTAVIVCGGLAKYIVPHASEKVIFDETLVLDGLYDIYKRNI